MQDKWILEFGTNIVSQIEKIKLFKTSQMYVHLLIRALTTIHDGVCSGWNNGILGSFNFFTEHKRMMPILGGK